MSDERQRWTDLARQRDEARAGADRLRAELEEARELQKVANEAANRWAIQIGKVEAERDRYREALDKALGIAGTLDTQTGLVGRGDLDRLRELERRRNRAAAELRKLARAALEGSEDE